MKHKTIIYSIISFFLLVNIVPIIEKGLGFLLMPITILLLVAFVIFLIITLYFLFVIIKDKFKTKHNNTIFFILLFIQLLVFFFPHGLFYKIFEKEPLFIAEREGGANCKTFIKLYSENKLLKREVCFGVEERNGRYEKISVDSIKFIYDDSETTFGKLLFDKNGNSKSLLYYNSKNDTIPIFMEISFDRLKIKK